MDGVMAEQQGAKFTSYMQKCKRDFYNSWSKRLGGGGHFSLHTVQRTKKRSASHLKNLLIHVHA